MAVAYEMGFHLTLSIEALEQLLHIQVHVELTQQTGNAAVTTTGIVQPRPDGDCAWCRVVEFAEEFGISVSYDPLVLGERRGG